MLIALAMTLSLSVTAFAGDTGNTGTTPINTTIAASSYNFTVSENITFTGTANSNDATASSHVVTNNSTVGSISVALNLANSDWTAKAWNTTWGLELIGSKTFGIQTDEAQDMYATIGKTGYASCASLAPNASDTTTLAGKTAAQETAVSGAHIGDIVATIAWV